MRLMREINQKKSTDKRQKVPYFFHKYVYLTHKYLYVNLGHQSAFIKTGFGYKIVPDVYLKSDACWLGNKKRYKIMYRTGTYVYSSV